MTPDPRVPPAEHELASLIATVAALQAEMPKQPRDYVELGELIRDALYDLEMLRCSLGHEQKGSSHAL